DGERGGLQFVQRLLRGRVLHRIELEAPEPGVHREQEVPSRVAQEGVAADLLFLALVAGAGLAGHAVPPSRSARLTAVRTTSSLSSLYFSRMARASALRSRPSARAAAARTSTGSFRLKSPPAESIVPSSSRAPESALMAYAPKKRLRSVWSMGRCSLPCTTGSIRRSAPL